MGTLTMSSRLLANGTSSSKYCHCGASCWTHKCNSSGFQSLHFNNSFAKLHIDSDMMPHLKGQGAPPNVSWSMMMVIASSSSCIAVFKAVLKWRMHFCSWFLMLIFSDLGFFFLLPPPNLWCTKWRSRDMFLVVAPYRCGCWLIFRIPSISNLDRE